MTAIIQDSYLQSALRRVIALRPRKDADRTRRSLVQSVEFDARSNLWGLVNLSASYFHIYDQRGCGCRIESALGVLELDLHLRRRDQLVLGRFPCLECRKVRQWRSSMRPHPNAFLTLSCLALRTRQLIRLVRNTAIWRRHSRVFASY